MKIVTASGNPSAIHGAVPRALGLLGLGALAASAITAIIMWRRVKAKRRILAYRPPPVLLDEPHG